MATLAYPDKYVSRLVFLSILSSILRLYSISSKTKLLFSNGKSSLLLSFDDDDK